MRKRSWETPVLEVFGSMSELTTTPAIPLPMNAPNAKYPDPFDGAPLADCPPGQVKMDGSICGDGAGGVS